MNNKVRVLGQNVELHLLLKLNADCDETALLREVWSAGIMVGSVTEHWSGLKNTYADTFILGFGTLTVEDLEDGVERLAEAWFGSE
ncbi:hypothetical protein [Cohnella nanjingensis]|nr:hypothetical protein [Cohnella nanjingensis]